ncbi:MAG TPA: hypothetical protein VIH27_04595 [Nitrososphaerales archaeon]
MVAYRAPRIIDNPTTIKIIPSRIPNNSRRKINMRISDSRRRNKSPTPSITNTNPMILTVLNLLSRF